MVQSGEGNNSWLLLRVGVYLVTPTLQHFQVHTEKGKKSINLAKISKPLAQHKQD